ncbi:MAG: hypothetical protein GX317_11405, partial [Staphylococcus equorum]|nr:hypothetical protein [Staphylococcus equorum]
MIKKLSFIILASGLVLSACSNGSGEEKDSKDQKHEEHMEHKSENKVPEDMESTEESKFKKGDEVTITAG